VTTLHTPGSATLGLCWLSNSSIAWCRRSLATVPLLERLLSNCTVVRDRRFPVSDAVKLVISLLLFPASTFALCMA